MEVCEGAELSLRQARSKLDDLQRTSQLVHQSAGWQPTEAGTALRWNQHKGFGFIQPRNGGGPGGGGDLFCHWRDILDGAYSRVSIALVKYTLSHRPPLLCHCSDIIDCA